MKIRFSRGITNTPNMPVHEKIVLGIGYTFIGQTIGALARMYYNDWREAKRLMEQEAVAQVKLIEDSVREWPEKKVSGVHVDDLKYRPYIDAVTKGDPHSTLPN